MSANIQEPPAGYDSRNPFQLHLDNFERHDQTDDAVGSVYTPPLLAEWTAQQLIRFAGDCHVLRALDPACGDGALLAALQKSWPYELQLIGRDRDAQAAAIASQRLSGNVDISVGDSLVPSFPDEIPNAIIANPPWNAPDPVLRQRLHGLGYSLAQGQCDLYELFVEHFVRSLPKGVTMAFILPDSIFLPEHGRVRHLLTNETQILSLARLGEGLFPGVYRGTVVIVFRTGFQDNNEIECFRLLPHQRREFLAGEVALDEIREQNAYLVSQERFRSNPQAEFTLGVRKDDILVGKLNSVDTIAWRHWLSIGRGVELGKKGQTLRCQRCSYHRPMPRAGGTPECAYCGAILTNTERATVIRAKEDMPTSDAESWRSLIVGEDVQRYRCAPSKVLQIGLPGIRYKDLEAYSGAKLLIRKTGIGIRAVVDYSGSVTTQTVFHFIPKKGAPELLLHYLAGVLNSRVMLAFHLRWSGDSEWRSHPYITPKTVLSLPVANPFQTDLSMEPGAEAIAHLAQQRCEGREVDFAIERAVGDFYGLTESDWCWVADVLEEAQSLQGIKELRLNGSFLSSRSVVDVTEGADLNG